MPSAPLSRRFGPDVRRRLDQALGHAAEPFDALIPPKSSGAGSPLPSLSATLTTLHGLSDGFASSCVLKTSRSGASAPAVLDLIFGRVDKAAQGL